MKNLESGKAEFGSAGEFLLELKKEFGGENKESIKVVELKRIEQGEKIIEEFIQEFWRTARRSGYKRGVLVKEFKRGINRMIRKKLIKTERPLKNIEQ